MPCCPNCKCENITACGICRECGQDVTIVVDPSRELTAGEYIGDIIIHTMMVGFAVAIAFALASLLGIILKSYPLIGLLVSTFTIATASFALGIGTNPWLSPVSAIAGCMIAFLPIFVFDTDRIFGYFTNFAWSALPIDTLGPTAILWFVCANISAVSILCGSRFKRENRWFYIVIPLFWSAAVIVLVSLLDYIMM